MNMTALKSIPSNVVKKRPGFNGQGELDLDSLTRLHEPEFKDATFLYFEFTDLEAVDTDTEDFWNVGVRRENAQDSDRIASYQNSFSKNNFDMTFWPPSRDTDGNWLDGRGRICAAKKNGERWIPTAVYSRNDSSKKNTVTNGLISNQQDRPQAPATFEDYVTAGVYLIHNKQLQNQKTAIDAWLYKDVNIERVYDNSINGQITRLTNKIMSEAKETHSLVLKKSTDQWKTWIEKHLGLKKSDYVLVNTKDVTYTERLWCRHIMPAVEYGEDPVDIIFYSSEDNPDACRSGLKDSVEFLEKFYKLSFKLVNSQLSGIVSINPPDNRPWNVLGAVPQIVQEHPIAGSDLIKVDRY